MENVKKVFEESTLDWVKVVAQKKYDGWVSSINEFENMQDDDITDAQISALSSTEQFKEAVESVKRIKQKIKECDNFEELDILLKSIEEKNSQSFANLIGKVQTHDDFFVEEVKEETIDFASMTIEGDILKDILQLKTAYDVVLGSLKKIGYDTPTTDVDEDDLKYIFNDVVTKYSVPVIKWIKKNTALFKNVNDDVTILEDNNSDFDARKQAIENIEHYIDVSSGVDIPEILGDTNVEIENKSTDRLGVLKKIQEFYIGTNSLAKLVNISELCKVLYIEIIEINK